MTSFHSYYDLGLRALSAAQLGLQVTGDNIANVNTPGFARRRLDLTPGFPIQVQGGFLSRGVEVGRIRRLEDRFLQASLQREKAALGYSQERLRGLQDVESLFGTLEDEGILTAYTEFANSFSSLAVTPGDTAQRTHAISSADTLARQIRSTYERLQAQRRTEDRAVEAEVQEINRLAFALSELNSQIFEAEVDGGTAAPLRDERQLVVEKLVDLTGGVVGSAEGGRVIFSLAGGGHTLVNNTRDLSLTISKDPQGFTRVASSTGVDVTDTLRDGKLGALLSVRDDTIAARLATLDDLAADLITRTNAVTTSAIDLNGNPGGPLFEPSPAPLTGAAASIAVAFGADQPEILAISLNGDSGDGQGAVQISDILATASAALGGKTPAGFLGDDLSLLGTQIVQADVETAVAGGLVETLELRRDAVSGVSLDEEAVELIRYQQAFESAARFIQVLNEINEIAVNLV